jgi:hypothetical protein
MEILRTIFESQEAQAVLDLARETYPRFDDGWLSWTWRLARNPLIGAFEVESGRYLFKSYSEFKKVGVPETIILYRIVDENSIEIIHVKVHPI